LSISVAVRWKIALLARRQRWPRRCAVYRGIAQLRQISNQDLDRHLARDFSSGMPSHSIGDHEQTALLVGIREIVVLVSRPDHTGIRPRGDGKQH
jgi:hypothetical protein